MSESIPSSSELLNTLRKFLEQEIAPQVNARSAYMLKIASNLLQILDRENHLGTKALAKELASLKTLLGRTDCAEKTEELRVVLCRQIQTGEMNLKDPALWKHLLSTTQSQLSIDNPRYQFAPEIF